MSNNTADGFLKIFEERFEKIKSKIKDELKKDKKHRDRDFLKRLLHDTKTSRKMLKEAKKHLLVTCPHCNKTFDLDKVKDSK
jgi:rubrerythrin